MLKENYIKHIRIYHIQTLVFDIVENCDSSHLISLANKNSHCTSESVISTAVNALFI